MNEARSQLIEAAKAVCGEFSLRKNFSAGSVSSAIRTAKGNVYTGICIDLACGIVFCAEVAAVAEMLKHRETQIDEVVVVSNSRILGAPCGRCREMMVQVDVRNLDCKVIFGKNKEVSLRELIPNHWLSKSEDIELSNIPDSE